MNTLIQQLVQQLQGHEVGKMDYKGEMRDIIIKVPDITRSELGELLVRSGNQEFRLNEIATITQSQAPKEIYRRNQNRLNKIVADLEAGSSLDKVAREIRGAVADVICPSVIPSPLQVRKRGAESMESLFLPSPICCVGLWCWLQYESLLHPFTILLTTCLVSLLYCFPYLPYIS